MGFARLAESSIRKMKGKGEDSSLGAMDKILASSIGGALATWNQPIEVIRVEVHIFYSCITFPILKSYYRCNRWQKPPSTGQ
jgi:hypothetical protein